MQISLHPDMSHHGEHTVKLVAAMTGRHMVELVVSPTQVVMSEKVESVTSTGEVPAGAGWREQILQYRYSPEGAV